MQGQVAVLAGGCFWCLEAVFLEVRGVLTVESGYCGGTLRDPGYEEVCGGRSGHAEAVRIGFDPQVVSYRQLLDVFFGIHDPTTVDRQGHDVGSRYRSAIFVVDAGQRREALATIEALERELVFDAPIVTQVVELGDWYPAEPHHQRYFEQHPHQGYCVAVVAPKVARFRARFAHLRARP